MLARRTVAAVAVFAAVIPVVPARADNVLPLIREDTRAGSASVIYRINATDNAPFAIEVFATNPGSRFATDVIETWPADGSGPPEVYTRVASGGSFTRVRAASEPLGVDADTDPNGGLLITGSADGGIEGQLPQGLWNVMIMSSASQPNTDTTFHVHGVSLSVDAASFGSAFVAGPEQFAATANATALQTTTVVNGHVPFAASTLLSGIFAAYTSGAIYSGPDGAHVVAGAAVFNGAPAGSYDFTALLGVSPIGAPLSPYLAVADVALPS